MFHLLPLVDPKKAPGKFSLLLITNPLREILTRLRDNWKSGQKGLVVTVSLLSLIITSVLVKSSQDLRKKAKENSQLDQKQERLYVADELIVELKTDLSSIEIPKQDLNLSKTNKKDVATEDLEGTDSLSTQTIDLFNKYNIKSVQKIIKNNSKNDVRGTKQSGKEQKEKFSKTVKVKFDPNAYFAKHNTKSNSPSRPNLDQTLNPEQLALLLMNNSDLVEYAEPNYLMKTHETIPNDPQLSDQWGLKNLRNPTHDVLATHAWDVTTGNIETIIAVIDTGIDTDHEDRPANIWANVDEIPGNLVDDDNNGYIDDTNGYNFTLDTPQPEDHNGHGTHVSGIIAANTNNEIGIAGTCWSCTIMPLKTFDSNGYGNTIDGANAIYYAVENGAHIINASWGGPISQTIKTAVEYAIANDVLFVASAGNSSFFVNQFSPAGIPGVLTVGAINDGSYNTDFTNTGEFLDIMAPGYSILSTYSNPSISYTNMSGTSMAAPFVSGIAGLLHSQGVSTTTSMKKILLGSANNLGSPESWDSLTGFGRVNALQAVERTEREITAIISNFSSNEKFSDAIASVPIRGYAFSQNEFSHYTLEVGEGDNPATWSNQQISLINDGLSEILETDLATLDNSQLSPGDWTLKLTVYDTLGNNNEFRTTFSKHDIVTIVVDDDNNTGIEDGSAEHPYSTINAGVENANEHDTIFVKSGFYTEQVWLQKNHLTLEGESAETTIINLPTEFPNDIGWYQPAIGITHSNANLTIEGVTVKNITAQIPNEKRYGIQVNGYAQDITIQENKVIQLNPHPCSETYCSDYGIYVNFYSNNVKITGNTVSGFMINIKINGEGNKNVSVSNNYLSNSNYAGLELHPSPVSALDGVAIQNNLFVNNTFAGIINWSNQNNTMKNNVFVGNKEAIDLFNSPNQTVYHNSFIDNQELSESQIFISNSHSLTWTDSVFNTGNYWSNFDHNFEGAYDTDGDWVINYPYTIDSENQDPAPYKSSQGRNTPIPPVKVTPLLLYPGSQFTLHNQTASWNFGTANLENKVYLNTNGPNTTLAQIVSWSEQDLILKVPQTTRPGLYEITIESQSQLFPAGIISVLNPNDYQLVNPPSEEFDQAVRIDPIAGESAAYIAIDPSSDIQIQTDFTIDAWVKPDDKIISCSDCHNPHTILSKEAIPGERAGYALEIAGSVLTFSTNLKFDDGTRVAPEQAVLLGSTVLEADQWYFIRAIKKQNLLSLYLNGNLETSATLGPPAENISEHEETALTIGCMQPQNFPICLSRFNGEIDEVRLSAIARNGNIIPQGPFNPDQDTAALWRFNGDSNDSSGNNHTGTISGNVDYTYYVQSTINTSPLPSPLPTNTTAPTPPPSPTLTPIPTPTPIVNGITGHVYDSVTGSPLEGVAITVYTLKIKGKNTVVKSTATDVLGNYLIELDPATYEVRAEVDGYKSQIQELTIVPGTKETFDFYLKKLGKPVKD